MPTVWIAQEQRQFDYSPAEKFGEVKFMSMHEYSKLSSGGRNDQLLAELRKAAAEFNPDTDYLVLTGSPTLMGVVAHMVLSQHPTIRTLVWNNQTREYRPLLIEIGEENDGQAQATG